MGRSAAGHHRAAGVHPHQVSRDFICFMRLDTECFLLDSLFMLLCCLQNIWADWTGDSRVSQSRPRSVWWPSSRLSSIYTFPARLSFFITIQTVSKAQVCLPDVVHVHVTVWSVPSHWLLRLWLMCNLSGRADPDCMLGQLLKMLFMNDDFTNAVRTDGSLIELCDEFSSLSNKECVWIQNTPFWR